MKIRHYDGTRYDFVLEKLGELGLSSRKVVFDIGAGRSEVRNGLVNIRYDFREFDILPKASTVGKWDIEEK